MVATEKKGFPFVHLPLEMLVRITTKAVKQLSFLPRRDLVDPSAKPLSSSDGRDQLVGMIGVSPIKQAIIV